MKQTAYKEQNTIPKTFKLYHNNNTIVKPIPSKTNNMTYKSLISVGGAKPPKKNPYLVVLIKNQRKAFQLHPSRNYFARDCMFAGNYCLTLKYGYQYVKFVQYNIIIEDLRWRIILSLTSIVYLVRHHTSVRATVIRILYGGEMSKISFGEEDSRSLIVTI